MPLALGLVEGAALHLVGEEVRAGETLGRVGVVLIALAVAELLHQLGRGVADMGGRHQGAGLVRRLLRRLEGFIDADRLRRGGQMDHGLSQRQLPLRRAEEVVGVLGRVGDQNGQGVGLTDVLDRHAHDAARQIERVFAPVQHPRQPVERRVRIRSAHRLMQGRDEVVVLFPRLVVGGGAFLKHARQRLHVQRFDVLQVEQHLGHGQQIAAVAIRQRQHGLTRLGRQRQELAHQRLGPIEQQVQRSVVQPLQHIDLRPRQQGAVQLEARVFGRGADQGDDPLLHEGQEAVLLGAVEAVDLVHEQQGLLARRPAHPRGLERLLQVCDAREDGADRLVFIARRLGQQAGDRRLARARRPPQDHGAQTSGLDHAADGAALAQQMVLAHHLIQRLRAQTVGQGRVGRMDAGGFEQISHGTL